MKPNAPQLILYDTGPDFFESLAAYKSELPFVRFEIGKLPHVTHVAALDASWTTPMGALELYGINPPFPLHEARVHRTPETKLKKGHPRYLVVGVATSLSDPRTPEFNINIVLSALLRAVDEFNGRSSDKIKRIGILPEQLDLRRLDPPVAARLLREAYEKHRRPPNSGASAP